MSFLDLSSYTGLLATAALTLNMLLGMLLGTAYKRHRLWKRLPSRIQQIRVQDVHNWTAYVALLLVLLHPVLLLFDPETKFKLPDIVFPIEAPHQKLPVALGTIAMFALILVIVTTQKVVKRGLTFRTWKNIHLVSYGTAILFIIHGIVLDPQLKDRPVDFFDGEKLVSEGCAVVLLIATVLRYNYYKQTKDRLRSKQSTLA
jgi:methionine sulfoxide reductase heme-binding subunit